jgi:hypothetical protein
MNTSNSRYDIPTVSDPEPSNLDRRYVAVVAGICLLICIPLAMHFAPELIEFLKGLAS